jgi:cytochrome c oxidase assembly protein subunit 15
MNNQSSNRAIIIWLVLIIFMVFCMVFIGGITRLTDSGLSMVNWRPLMGAIPPLSEAEWLSTFNAYKAFPEYLIINKGMSLSEFKMIFFWEYFHRLFGRMIGLVFFFPYVYFFFTKKISKTLNKKLLVAFILGGLQGLMGWYMVKSGLVNKPDVSHYRLAAHLSLAFAIIGYIYWLVLDLRNPGFGKSRSNKLSLTLNLFFLLLCIQIIYGALVAGLDAGLTYNTFPKMGQNWLPRDAMFMQPLWSNFLENTGTVQFIHRTFGWLLVIIGSSILYQSKSLQNLTQKKSIQFVALALILQFLLGVVTLVMIIPVPIASMHQIGACVLFTLTLRALFFTHKSLR